MDQILEAWFGEIYDSLRELDFVYEKLPEYADYEYVFIADDEGLIVYGREGVGGLVFICIDDTPFDFDNDYDKIFQANTALDIAKISTSDFKSVSYSFFYPYFADPEDVFQNTFLKFLREVNEVSKWMNDPASDLQN